MSRVGISIGLYTVQRAKSSTKNTVQIEYSTKSSDTRLDKDRQGQVRYPLQLKRRNNRQRQTRPGSIPSAAEAT